MEQIKIGDLVEDCSLMPGVVMGINGDDIRIRRLDLKNSTHLEDFSHCSLKHCGIILLTPEQVIKRLVLGKEKLAELWREIISNDEFEDIGEPYEKLINKTYYGTDG